MKKLLYIVFLLGLISCKSDYKVIEGDIIQEIEYCSSTKSIYITRCRDADNNYIAQAMFKAKVGLYQVGDIVKFCK